MDDVFQTTDLGDGSRPDVSITIGGYLNSASGAMRLDGYIVKKSGGKAYWYDSGAVFDGGPFDNIGDALQYIADRLMPHVHDHPTRRGGWRTLAE